MFCSSDQPSVTHHVLMGSVCTLECASAMKVGVVRIALKVILIAILLEKCNTIVLSKVLYQLFMLHKVVSQFTYVIGAWLCNEW